MTRILNFLLTILLAGLLYLRGPVLLKKIETYIAPCRKPIAYDIGQLDPRFKLSKQSLIQDIAKGEQVWESPLNHEFFVYTPGAAFKVNLIYDYRQEETDRQTALNSQIENEVASIDQLTERYNTLLADYNKRLKTYNQQVAYWNRQGGAPEEEYQKLESERIKLNSDSQKLSAMQSKINTLADSTNQKIETFNSTPSRVFDKGVYQRDQSKEEINIYEFENENELVLALAHELGHAVGLDHLTHPTSIMYPVLKDQPLSPLKATDEDLTAITDYCRL